MSVKDWIADRVGIVKLRQIAEDLTHRLAFLPIVMVLVAVMASQASLAIDRWLGDTDVPLPLSTTVESSRAIFAAVAGGLITAVTLLLSIMLIAVQLASAQFSPRTLRNWLGDRVLRWAIGFVLATTVFCLMGLRSVRDVGDIVVIPTVTVLIAVVLGVSSLAVMIRAVDHVTRSLQVGTVAQQLVGDTIGIIRSAEGGRANEDPVTAPASGGEHPERSVPANNARVIEATKSGWVQQIDEEGILHGLPEGASAWIAVAHGAYVTTHSPLARVDVGPSNGHPLDDEVVTAVRRSFALGPTRTMQQDVGFGLQQLTDIAVRALSPGVNDPQTASDIVVHLGEVLREVWSYPRASGTVSDGPTSVHRLAPAHVEHLRAALDPIRRYGNADPDVMATLVTMLRHLRSEVVRRDLAGPVGPIDDYLDDVIDRVDDADWLAHERERFFTDAATNGAGLG